jgi:hypothetical protein
MYLVRSHDSLYIHNLPLIILSVLFNQRSDIIFETDWILAKSSAFSSLRTKSTGVSFEDILSFSLATGFFSDDAPVSGISTENASTVASTHNFAHLTTFDQSSFTESIAQFTFLSAFSNHFDVLSTADW